MYGSIYEQFEIQYENGLFRESKTGVSPVSVRVGLGSVSHLSNPTIIPIHRNILNYFIPLSYAVIARHRRCYDQHLIYRFSNTYFFFAQFSPGRLLCLYKLKCQRRRTTCQQCSRHRRHRRCANSLSGENRDSMTLSFSTSRLTKHKCIKIVLSFLFGCLNVITYTIRKYTSSIRVLLLVF